MEGLQGLTATAGSPKHLQRMVGPGFFAFRTLSSGCPGSAASQRTLDVPEPAHVMAFEHDLVQNSLTIFFTYRHMGYLTGF